MQKPQGAAVTSPQAPLAAIYARADPAPDTENYLYTSWQRHQPQAGRKWTLHLMVQVSIPQRGNQPPDPGGGPLPSWVETCKPPQHRPRLVLAPPEPERPRPRPLKSHPIPG
ncbi:hypothetical protein CHARACLAT_015177 [Characodon lateralis]|uniref:Uncharacterized protein n=1 Tax=Characodon lateralis TaxID=208331 RepID=A0ABU7CSI9_9TELE|nr:hypothetical protein [Characodon lateralis]